MPRNGWRRLSVRRLRNDGREKKLLSLSMKAAGIGRLKWRDKWLPAKCSLSLDRAKPLPARETMHSHFLKENTFNGLTPTTSWHPTRSSGKWKKFSAAAI